MALAKVALLGTATLNGSPTAVSITATPVPAASERPAFSLLAPDVQTLSVPSSGALAGLTLDVPGPAGTWPLEGVTYLVSATAGGVTNTFQVFLNDAVKKVDLSGELTFKSAPVESHPVTSVAGKTGAVTLAKSDVGLSNVDNTADTAKPISTAVQTALNGKAATDHEHAGEDITSGTVAYARLPVGTAASTVAAGNDSRLSNARTPTAHASSHASGGSDEITPAAIGAAATTHAHSFDVSDVTGLQAILNDYETRIAALEATAGGA